MCFHFSELFQTFPGKTTVALLSGTWLGVMGFMYLSVRRLERWEGSL